MKIEIGPITLSENDWYYTHDGKYLFCREGFDSVFTVTGPFHLELSSEPLKGGVKIKFYKIPGMYGYGCNINGVHLSLSSDLDALIDHYALKVGTAYYVRVTCD